MKRSAIVASGRFWTWSVTHQDVSAAIDGNADSSLEPATVALNRHDGSKAPATVPRAQEKAFTQHAVARLLHWLATPFGSSELDGAVDVQQRNAAWLTFLMVPATTEDKAVAEAQRAPWLAQLPLNIREPGSGFAPVMSRASGPVSVLGWWPMGLAKGHPSSQNWVAPGMVSLDGSAAADEEVLHVAWRRWLQLFNALQFLPGMLLTTSDGISAHDYDALTPPAAGAAPAQSAAQAALNAAWQEVVQQALEALAPGLKQLAQSGAALPEVGLELIDAKGRISADSELAWAQEKVVVLRPDQADLIEHWGAENWKVVLLDESLSLSAGEPWFAMVATSLGVDVITNEGGTA